MRFAIWVFLTACLAAGPACTSLQPTEASPEEIQRLILSEGLLEPGQRVRIVTAAGAEHEFRITELDMAQGAVVGEQVSVPVVDIVAVETREVSVGRTALLTGGLVWGAGLIIAIAIAPAVLLGGG